MNIEAIRQEQLDQEILAGLAPVRDFPPVPLLSTEWERPPSWWERVRRAVGRKLTAWSIG